MTRTSLLTQGLEPLAQHSRELHTLLERLYELDDELQAAHVRAKQDDEFGEEVVTRYQCFLAHREELVTALGEQQVPVPWQLRMRIDDIELTLRQREEKQSGANEKKSVILEQTTTKVEKEAPSTAEEVKALPPASPASPTERRVVTLLVPSLVVLVLALLWFQWFS